MAVQADIFAGGAGPGFAAKVRENMRGAEWLAVPDVAEVMGVANSTVREWIEEGRLPAADLNAGRRSNDRPVRPYWRVMRAAVVALAERIERGC